MSEMLKKYLKLPQKRRTMKEIIISLIEHIFHKLTSVRLIVTLLFTYTYCKILVWALEMTAEGILSVETFLGILAGFTPLVILITEWYFKRVDRPNIEKE